MGKKRKKTAAPAETPVEAPSDKSDEEPEEVDANVGDGEVDEGVIVVGTYEGALLGFGLDGAQTFGYAPHVGCVKAVTCSRMGRLASGGTDHSVKLFDLIKGVELGELQEHQDTVACVDFAGTASLITAGDDGQVIIWRMSDWELLLKFNAHKSGVACVAAHPSGRLMATAGRDRSLRLWDLTRGTSAANLAVDTVVESIEWAPDGNHLAALSARQLIVVDARTAAMCSYTEPCNASSVSKTVFTALCFLRDDVCIVGDDKCALRVIRAVGDTMAEACRLPAVAERRGRCKAIVRCSETAEGVSFAIGMSLGTVEVWSLAHGVVPTTGAERVLTKLHTVNTGTRLTCLTAWAPSMALEAAAIASAVKKTADGGEAKAAGVKVKKKKKRRQQQ